MRPRPAADPRRVRSAGALETSGALVPSRPAAIGQTTNGAADIEVAGGSPLEPSAELEGVSRKPVAQRNLTGVA